MIEIPTDTPDIKFGLIEDLGSVPLYNLWAACGFPSPADEYLEDRIDIADHLVKNNTSTFFAWARGKSMSDAFIADGALLVIDKSLPYRKASKFLIFYDGGYTVKLIRKDGEKTFLVPAHPEHKEIEVQEGVPFHVWGTITYSINSHYKW